MRNQVMTLERQTNGGNPVPNSTFVRPRPGLILYYRRGPPRSRPRESVPRQQPAPPPETDALLHKLLAWQEAAVGHVVTLTPREHQIMDLILAGTPNKNIAADLGISQRTVENHRASIMRKTGVKSVAALARLGLLATWTDARGQPS